MEKYQEIRLIAFDADDTLWDCQGHFDRVEEEYARILSPYRRDGQGSPQESLFKTETANMPLLGYGCKAFTISLVENAVSYSHGSISADEIGRIVELGKSLLRLPATPFSGVEDTLRALQESRRYRLVVFTKGELLDQENKLRRSGLAPYFDDVIVVSDKSPESYQSLCHQNGVAIGQMAMVGNSFKSDIAPVLKLGGAAVYIPSAAMWQHEVVPEFPHERLVKVNCFADLTSVFL